MSMKTEQPQPAGKTGDIESGNPKLYPTMVEDPKLRWTFIRKVYMILTLQLLLTIAVAVIVPTVHPIGKFFFSPWIGFTLGFAVLFLPLLVLRPSFVFRPKHPSNILMFSLFTISVAFSVGICCLFTDWRVILEISILIAAVTIKSHTLHTFWLARGGHDFKFIFSFLVGSLLVLQIFGVIQILHPFGKLPAMIYSYLGTIIFSAHIIYDTTNLINQYYYDEYIWASVGIYLDIINLLFGLVNIISIAST